MADTSTTKVLRTARETVWKALRQWTLWTETIRQNYESDDEVRRFIASDPNVSRLPALSVLWRTSNPEWWVHTLQDWKVPLEISVWVPDDRQSLAEDLLEDVVDAVMRTDAPSSTTAAPVSLMKQLTGAHPTILSLECAVPVAAGADGRHRLLQSSVVFQLSLRKDPIKRAGA